ncbi:MAG TPA: DUF2062 domain-containing protein [Candidatus Binatia bacterium]|nr:DUF2062 domain-containing protein [Candidatus Binatia bacterium]
MTEGPRERTWPVPNFRELIRAQLRQGLTTSDIALTLALGATLGLFPIVGATTALCALAALVLRLNQPLMQAVNYALSPLQLLLLIPFYRAGERLFGAAPVPIVDVAELARRFAAGPWQFLADYGRVGLYGITVWALLAPAVSLGVYALALPLLRGIARK